MVKNKHYKQFLKGEYIELVEDHHIEKALNNIGKRNTKEAKALLCLLYYTGARPAEILELKGKDISRERHKLILQIHTLKRGRNRTMIIPVTKQFSKYIIDWCFMIYPELYLFPHFRSKSMKVYKTKAGPKVHHETSDRLRYHFNVWFKGIFEEAIPPYFLRHSRFSTFVKKGATIEDIMQIKGAKKIDSVYPYLHLDRSKANKLSRML